MSRKLFAFLIIHSIFFFEAVYPFLQLRNASFSNESALSWDPFVYDPSCPRFLISELGMDFGN